MTAAVYRKSPTIGSDRLGKTLHTYGAPKGKNNCDYADEDLCHIHLRLAEKGGRDEYRTKLKRVAKHFWAIVAPVADGGVGGGHLHLVGVVGVEKVEWWSRIPSAVVDAKPAIIVSRVQVERVIVSRARGAIRRMRYETGP